MRNELGPPPLPFLLQSGTAQLQSHGNDYAYCALFMRATGQKGQWGLRVSWGLLICLSPDKVSCSNLHTDLVWTNNSCGHSDSLLPEALHLKAPWYAPPF